MGYIFKVECATYISSNTSFEKRASDSNWYATAIDYVIVSDNTSEENNKQWKSLLAGNQSFSDNKRIHF